MQAKMTERDRPKSTKPGYFLGFGAFFFAFFFNECGFGGVFNRRRRTSFSCGDCLL